MIPPISSRLCKAAEIHYFDIVFGDREADIPTEIVRHVEKCQDCQAKIARLRQAIVAAEKKDPEQKQVDLISASNLRLHFAFVDRPVTCSNVKPFLPLLFDPLMQVRVPTPITVHIDRCKACRDDLGKIGELNLESRQLRRLSQVFSDSPDGADVGCEDAKAGLLFVVLMTLRETDARILKHVCLCAGCRRLLHEHRESLLRECARKEQKEDGFPCEKVRPADIFDYVVPYGLEPSKDQYAKFRESLTSHLRTCPMCLGAMQHLHDVVYGIAERGESGIETIYRINAPAGDQTWTESEDICQDSPISVEIVQRHDSSQTRCSDGYANFSAQTKRSISQLSVKHLARAAAVIVVGILVGALFLYSQSAKAVTLAEIHEALVKAANVYIASFVPGKDEPIEERWISRTLNVHLIRTQQTSVLWDLRRGERILKNLDTNVIERQLLSPEMRQGVEKTINGSLGLVPMTDLPLIVRGATWERIVDDSAQASDSATKIYDLITPGSAQPDSQVVKRWRFFVNPKTSLPWRVEFWQKDSGIEYDLKSVKTVRYLTEGEMRTIIEEPVN
jgi:hypothetical protein